MLDLLPHFSFRTSEDASQIRFTLPGQFHKNVLIEKQAQFSWDLSERS